MSKFLKLVNENLSNIDNPQGIFYLKLVNDKGQDVGHEPIELRGTTYAEDLFLKLKDGIKKGLDVDFIPDEDNEIMSGATALSDMGDKTTDAKLKKLKAVAKAKKSVIDNTITRITDTLSRIS